MFCPNCSQPQVSNEMQFCSRCGLPLSNLKELISAADKEKANQSKISPDKLSPRQKGVRQGAVLMILSVILIPAYILLAALFPANDRLVESAVSDTPFEKISQAILLTIFMLGLARLLYARFFQPATIGESDSETESAQFKNSASNNALPPAQSIPLSGFGAWRRNTGEMVESPTVTEHTTKSLRQ